MNSQPIIEHYRQCWGEPTEIAKWKQGPTEQLPEDFTILIFAPNERRNMWTYATCGMSTQGDATAIELHLFSPVHDGTLVELLTVIAHYHLTGAYLDLFHSINIGRPWLPQSKCDHGLISFPFLDGPNLERLELSERTIRFLWLIPITEEEFAF